MTDHELHEKTGELLRDVRLDLEHAEEILTKAERLRREAMIIVALAPVVSVAVFALLQGAA